MKTERILKKGEEFGDWTVIRRVRDGGGQKIYYECECSCGTIRPVNKYNLLGNRSFSCGCRRGGPGTGNCFKGHGELGMTYWNKLIEHAKSRNLTVDISIKQAWRLFEEQKRHCKLSGLPIKFGSRRLGTTASLDRIDSSRGYTIDNVQWVHKDVNRMKNHFGQDYFLDMCRRIAENN